MSVRLTAACLALLALICVFPQFVSSQSSPSTLSVLSREGRRTLPTSLVNDQEVVALDDLASMFQLVVHEEALGAVTVSYKGKTIVLTPDQALASVAGRLVSLPSPPTRSGRRVMVPLEFISRALSLIYDSRLDLRKPSRLLVVGDLRVPRVVLKYEQLGTTERLTIDATPRANSTVTQENDHLTIKFDADAIDPDSPPALPAQALVQAIRLADPVTVVVDLSPRLAGFRTSTLPIDNTMRLVIDLVAATTQTTENAPAATPAPAPVTPPAPDVSLFSPPVSSIRTIAIDPGHGGDDEGVNGAEGTKEKDVSLAVARRLKASIEARLGIRVLLTRDDDRTVPIDGRTAIANNNKADVFISLHANASFRNTVAGASIYTAAFERDAEQIARASLQPERVPTFGGGLRDIELVPWDLAQIPHVDRSLELARILEQLLKDRIPVNARPIDSAPLRVLESANMPAVLIEMGYLSNPEQEKQLASAEFQGAFVQAIVEAVVKFRDALDEGRRTTAGAGQ